MVNHLRDTFTCSEYCDSLKYQNNSKILRNSPPILVHCTIRRSLSEMNLYNFIHCKYEYQHSVAFLMGTLERTTNLMFT
jgi:hypothetical protein